MMNKEFWTSWIGLFSSLSTLVCCALPSLFIALGMGASFAGLLGVFPQIIWVSDNKELVFGASGFLIFISVLIIYLSRNQPCPVDPKKARACKVGRKWSKIMSGAAIVFWIVGFLFAFILG